MVALLKCQSDARLASATFHGAERLFMSQNAAGQPRALSFLFFFSDFNKIGSGSEEERVDGKERDGRVRRQARDSAAGPTAVSGTLGPLRERRGR